MELLPQELDLIREVKSYAKRKIISAGKFGNVACGLLTPQGNSFFGVNVEMWCGLGFCAERSAAASMLVNSNETNISSIVAYSDSDGGKIIPPCGACRQFIEFLDKQNVNTRVILSDTSAVLLKDLIPHSFFSS